MVFMNFNSSIKKVLHNNNVNFIRYAGIRNDCRPPWKILFFGTDEFSLFSLKELYSEYRNGNLLSKLEICTVIHNKKNPVHLFAEEQKLKLHGWPIKLLETEFHAGLVVSFGHLIPETVIKKFPLGMLNVHASLLPRWRGAAPIIHAIANGDRRLGVTIMKIKPKRFDTGEMISQDSIDISDEKVMPEIYTELGILGAKLLVGCLEELPENLQKARAQSEVDVTLAPKIDTDFAKINWKQMSALQIFNLQRALTGVLPLTTWWNGTLIRLYDITLDNKYNSGNIKLGSIQYDKNNEVLKVLCMDGYFINVPKVGIPGKKVMTATDFNNGYLKKKTLELKIFE